jgi:hypothetical protein
MNWTRLRSALAITGIIFLLLFFHNMPVTSNENPIDKAIETPLPQNRLVQGTERKESHTVYFSTSKAVPDVIEKAAKKAVVKK